MPQEECKEKILSEEYREERKKYGTVMGRPFYKRNGQAGLQF